MASDLQLLDLPDETLSCIFAHATPASVLSASASCKRLLTASEDPHVWQNRTIEGQEVKLDCYSKLNFSLVYVWLCGKRHSGEPNVLPSCLQDLLTENPSSLMDALNTMTCSWFDSSVAVLDTCLKVNDQILKRFLHIFLNESHEAPLRVAFAERFISVVTESSDIPCSLRSKQISWHVPSTVRGVINVLRTSHDTDLRAAAAEIIVGIYGALKKMNARLSVQDTQSYLQAMEGNTFDESNAEQFCDMLGVVGKMGNIEACFSTLLNFVYVVVNRNSLKIQNTHCEIIKDHYDIDSEFGATKWKRAHVKFWAQLIECTPEAFVIGDPEFYGSRDVAEASIQCFVTCWTTLPTYLHLFDSSFRAMLTSLGKSVLVKDPWFNADIPYEETDTYFVLSFVKLCSSSGRYTELVMELLPRLVKYLVTENEYGEWEDLQLILSEILKSENSPPMLPSFVMTLFKKLVKARKSLSATKTKLSDLQETHASTVERLSLVRSFYGRSTFWR